MKKVALTLALIFAFATITFAQKSRKEQTADSYYNTYSYVKAIEYYEKVKELTVDGQRHLADSYLKVRDIPKAYQTYERFIHKAEVTKNDLYKYITVLKMKGENEKAEEWMKSFCEKFPNDNRSKSYLASLPYQKQIKDGIGQFRIENLKFNSEDIDFAPAFYGDSVVFTSSRGRKLKPHTLYSWNQKPFLSLYVAKVASGQFTDLQPLNKTINKKWHQGTTSFSNNGRYMAFTRDNYETKSKDGVVNLQIYFALFNGKDWTKPIAFKLNNPEYSVGHPSLSRDGRTMYFVSNKPGGFGGVDIYKITKDSTGAWGKEENLGPTINTEGDEMFPFFEEKSQTLFFSSTGLYGNGGLDVFRSKYSKGQFATPINLGAPINGRFDDFSFIIDPELKHGYFASNRDTGKGDDDIYSYVVLKSIYQQVFPHNLVVLSQDNNTPIVNAEVVYSDNQKFVTDSLGHIKRTLSKKSSLGYTINMLGYEPGGGKVTIGEPLDSTVFNDTVRLKVIVNKKIALKHVYYGFNKFDVTPATAAELDKVIALMSQNPEMKIELGAHTDNRGSDAYNLKLSQRRADAAVAYIVSKGIDAARIKAVGYGKSQLIKNCIECTEEEHSANRRTEINIPGYGNSLADSTLYVKDDSIAVQQKGKPNKKKSASQYKEKGTMLTMNITSIGEKEGNNPNAYFLYVASDPDRVKAKILADKLIGQGYNATVIDMPTFYRVGIGCKTLGAAKKLYRQLKSEYPSAWIDLPR